MKTEKELKSPETLQTAIIYFADADRAHNFMIGIRWPDRAVKCPRCDDRQVVDQLAETSARGPIHTNSLENFWSLLKRGLKGTYVTVEPFHLVRPLDEQEFRCNGRKDNDQGRFVKAVSGFMDKGLKYAKLIGVSLPPETTRTWQRA